MKWFKVRLFALAIALAPLSALAQGTVPGQFLVPMGFCQIPAATLASATKLTTAACVGASFTGTAVVGNATQVTVTSVTGSIKIGQVIAGTGITAGTTITGQVSGTTGGAGVYQLSASNTTSAASLTSGGVPTGATMAYLNADTNNVRFRDDGANPTASVGSVLVAGVTPILYSGTLTAITFIAVSGSPLLNVSFYRQ